jgi:hypothetical protein
VQFERKVKIVGPDGQTVLFERTYDLFDGKIFYECKNWLWHVGFGNPLFDGFPPPVPTIFQDPVSYFRALFRWEALRSAEIQWLRDITHLKEGAVGQLRWVFPKTMEPFANAIRLHFMNLPNSARLRQLITGGNAALDETYRRIVQAIADNIDEIIIFR